MNAFFCVNELNISYKLFYLTVFTDENKSDRKTLFNSGHVGPENIISDNYSEDGARATFSNSV